MQKQQIGLANCKSKEASRKALRVWHTLRRRAQNEMETTILPKWGQRDESGEEERIMTGVDVQDLIGCRKAGIETQESKFCIRPEDTQRIR